MCFFLYLLCIKTTGFHQLNWCVLWVPFKRLWLRNYQAVPAQLFACCLGNIWNEKLQTNLWNIFHFFACHISLLFLSYPAICFIACLGSFHSLPAVISLLFHCLPRLISFTAYCNFFAMSFLSRLISFTVCCYFFPA